MSAVGVFFRHLWAMLYKNFVIQLKSPGSLIAQLLAPIVFILFLWAVSFAGDTNYTPVEKILGGAPDTCVGGRISKSLDRNPCFSLLYTNNGTANSTLTPAEVDTIMQRIASQWGWTWSASWTNTSTEGASTIYKVPDFQTLQRFLIYNPNYTVSSVVWFPQQWIWQTEGPVNPTQYYPTAPNPPSPPSPPTPAPGPPYNPTTNAQFAVLYNSSNSDSTQASKNADGIVPIWTALQIETANLLAKKINPLFNLDLDFGSFPLDHYLRPSDEFDVVAYAGSLFMFIALMFNFAVFFYSIVNEKDLKLRLAMRLVGLSDVAYWLSWYIISVVWLIYASWVMIGVGAACGMPFFTRTHVAVLFLVLFLFGLCMNSIAICLGMLIGSTRAAVNVTFIFFLVGTLCQLIFGNSFIIAVLYDPSTLDPNLVHFFELFPFFNFPKMIADISSRSNVAAAAATPNGLLFAWYQIYETVSASTSTAPLPTFASTIGRQMIIWGIMTVLSWYLYNASPNEKDDGFIFFLKPAYWIQNRSQIKDVTIPNDPQADEDVNREAQSVKSGNAALKIFNLKRKFGIFKTKYAVNGVSFGIQQGEVFAMLGHNGAGKTTTINMLTGTLKPSEGEAVAFGMGITNSLPAVQAMVGFCPQHNAIWENLSPRQHLRLFCYLKGVPSEKVDAEIEQRLKDVLLLDVIDKEAGKFSGGMKRRLSVAIACVGDPKIIYLDEPTTGLDPMSRRVVWGTIQRIKKDKVVILTTHSLEEADLLGDRVGIMAHGKLQCIGTSLHLKNKFGIGYRLNLSAVDIPSVPSMKAEVGKFLTKSQILFESGQNVTYGIMTHDLQQMVPYAKHLESKASPYVRDYSLSQTTLEEVFVRLSVAAGAVPHNVVGAQPPQQPQYAQPQFAQPPQQQQFTPQPQFTQPPQHEQAPAYYPPEQQSAPLLEQPPAYVPPQEQSNRSEDSKKSEDSVETDN